jgi:hypothetical protein
MVRNVHFCALIGSRGLYLFSKNVQQQTTFIAYLSSLTLLFHACVSDGLAAGILQGKLLMAPLDSLIGNRCQLGAALRRRQAHRAALLSVKVSLTGDENYERRPRGIQNQCNG